MKLQIDILKLWMVCLRHTGAVFFSHAAVMNRRGCAETLLPSLALSLALAFAGAVGLAAPAQAAQEAGPAQEARLAMGACLAAVIDHAPVGDMQRMGVAVHRETAPNLCTVHVTQGDPEQARQAVLRAVYARPEGFEPARTRWDPTPFVSRETFCSAQGRRPLNVVVETGRPGGPLAVSATVVETPERDPRCDLDYGLQHP